MPALSRLSQLINFASLPILRTVPSPVAVRSAAWLVAAIVVGWVLANWFWQITLPEHAMPEENSTLPDYPTAAKRVAARHLFGKTSSSGDGAEAAGGPVSYKVTGAMTGSPERAGFAVIAEDGKPPMPVVEGETFQPGVTLTEILPGKVRLKIGERTETIEVAPQGLAQGRTTGGTAPAPAMQPRPEPPAPQAPAVPPPNVPSPDTTTR